MSQLFPSPTLTPHKPSCQIFGALLLVLCEHSKKVVCNFGTSCKDFHSENVRFLFFCPGIYVDLIISQHQQNDLSQILSCQNIVNMATTTEHILAPSFMNLRLKKITVHATDLSFLHDWTQLIDGHVHTRSIYAKHHIETGKLLCHLSSVAQW